MIRIDFNRQTGLATHPGFEGWGGAFTARAPDGYFDVIRAMVNAGQPDGPAAFYDERGMPCLTVASVHSCARRYRPTDADKAAREVRKKRRTPPEPPADV